MGGDDALRDAELLVEENTEPSDVSERVALDDEVGIVAGEKDEAPSVADGVGVSVDVYA
jgi:hypothetical protein